VRGSATADRPFRHDAAPRTVRVADGRLLDHEAPLRKPHLERGVVEVARRAPSDPGRQRLEQPAVEADEVAARAERQPVEIDGGAARCRCSREGGWDVRSHGAVWVDAAGSRIGGSPPSCGGELRRVSD